jgi:c-di-GMP-binding flagellar brake protein YcgR
MSSPSRQYPRYYFDGRVNITVYRPTGKCDFWGRIADLSESGMGATVAGELNQGEFVGLQFFVSSVSSLSQSLELRARVRHRRGYYCGFEFLVVSDVQRERIKLACEGLPTRGGRES